MAKRKTEWPADKVERIAIDKLVPYARNARTHSDEQVAQIAASMREWGWTNPVLIDEDGGIIAGHGRVLAARKLGFDEAPCLTATGWSDAKKRAYVLADNKLAMNAGWDDDLLRTELQELTALDFDMPLIGFDDAELDALLTIKTEGLTDPDEAPEPPVNPVTVTGDTWILGKHRLRCGDSTSADDVGALIGNNDVHICITDPPYGVGFDYNSHKDTKENLVQIIEGFFPLARAMCQTVLITPGNSNQRLYPDPDWTLCWFCSAGVGQGPWGFTCWQPILAYGKDPYLKIGKGSRPDGFESNEGKPKDIKHTCPKPVGVWRWLMDRADPSECATFYEPFSGSGTTLITAHMSGRKSLSMELDPAYVDVAVKRWQEFTGEKATLESTGQTFEEVSQERYDWEDDSAGSYDEFVKAKREELEKA